MSGPKAFRWNGEYWYEDEGLLSRLRKWFFWSGGWEAHHPRRRSFGRPWTLRERLGLLTPISLLGHRISFYGWGWQARLRGRQTLTRSKGSLYLSPDGTPGSATVWFKGAPPEVRAAAKESAEERQAMSDRFKKEADTHAH